MQPGAWIGVIGGGQLGRMFALEARRLNYRVCVLDPVAGAPAAQVADAQIVAPYEDQDAVAELARRVDVITYEFENVDADAVAAAEALKPVYPSSSILRVAQHRLREKETLSRHGIPVTGFRAVRTAADLEAALDYLGVPAVLKTATSGYDGKGQIVLRDRGEAAGAVATLNPAGDRELILEAWVDFQLELSVVCARGLDGAATCYPPGENHHARGILDVTILPARVPAAVAQQAQELARRIAQALDLVGVLAVEMFWTRDGRLLVNELAPRPHNSGHPTLDACPTSQFEQLLRAICGLPLGAVEPYAQAAMANLLGDLWSADGSPPDFAAVLAEPGVRLHLYGKGEARPGRKMGHLCVLAPTADEALERVLAARARLGGPDRSR
ncbi:MAG TPA: 5-(carboxyamino)imidazole ribonucleotide synthase [Bacillota bacterium]